MFSTTRILAVVLGVITLAVQAGAQGGGPRGGGGSAPIAKREIKPGLFMITGAGANSVVRVTPEGLILVDTKLDGEANFNGMMEQIRSISDKPVKIVLNTQHHPDHTGNNKRFIDAGAAVIALDALTKVDTVLSRASEAIRNGATRDQLMSRVKTDDLAPWALNEQFFTNLYDELTKAK